MNADVEALFHQVVDLPADARRAYFAAHQIDDDTSREVEALLAFESDASVRIEHDIAVAARLALPDLEAVGRRCGPYRLLHVLGRGGMGAVHLAERVDGEVTQRVAVKLLPTWAGDGSRERFLQERQILATVTHPNIARLIDAGHLDDGQPFLAMEYVDGQPIDVFAQGLSTRLKMRLFLKVCGAVGYLHRHLVVHRDLKPGNILVTADGEPKLLDFGIAKLLELSPDATVTGARMLTPAYASPEQLEGRPVSTASDIYSLGAMLYRLLTGHAPHEGGGASPSGAGDRVVAPPSTWAPSLKGDLDAIVLKALRPDPQDRYATVEHFAEDVDAWLTMRPVRARSDNAWYLVRKFLRRHWLPAAATAAVIASLAVGLRLADRERAVAQRRFADVRQLAGKLFDIDNEVRKLSGSTQARQLIVDTSLEYLRRLTAEVQGDPELTLEAATAYHSVAQVEGVTSGPNLGQLDAGERDLGIAAQLVDTVLASQPGNREAMLRGARIANDRAWMAWQRGRTDQALTMARTSTERLERFHARAGDEPKAAVILNVYSTVAHLFMLADQFDDALRLCARGGEIAQLLGQPSERSGFLTTVALVRRYQGDLDGALDAIREAVRLENHGPGAAVAPALNYAMALTWEGWILGEPGAISLGRTAEAAIVLDRAFAIIDRFVHEDSKNESSRSRLFLAGAPLGAVLRQTDPARALAVYDHTLRDMDDVHSTFLELRSVQVLAGASRALRHLGRPAEARLRLDRALAILKSHNLYPAPTIEVGAEAEAALSALADLEADTGDLPGAIGRFEDLLQRIEAGGADPLASLYTATDLSELYASLASLYRRAGRASQATALEARRLALWRHWDGKLPHNVFVTRQLTAQPAWRSR